MKYKAIAVLLKTVFSLKFVAINNETHNIMKTLNKTVLVLLAIATLSFTSCKKDDDGGEGGAAGSGTIVALVDGSSYKSDKMLTTANIVSAEGVNALVITGNTMDGRNISLNVMANFDGVGTYLIGGGANIFGNASYTEVDPNNPTDAQSWVAPYDTNVAGEIKVSEITDNTIKGTFHFKGKNADGSFKDITEGSFNVGL